MENTKTLSFVKYSGNGNDFIIVDHPDSKLEPKLIQRLCDRYFGVGADGVLTLTSSPGVDGVMRIFNSDGGEAEMCGNGLRCLVTYLDYKLSQKKNTYSIKTMNAIYEVSRKGDSFAIEMSEIKDKNLYDLSSFNEFDKSFYINTGVPHLVFLSKDVKKINIKDVAPKYRYHNIFPNGSNVSFVELIPGTQSAYVRTYERGVEDETHSCGTGLTACGLALSHWLGWTGDIHLQTKGGKQLVSIGEKIFYSGEVTYCFRGEMNL
ncbi:MAG: diaminopimelate epimerase [Bacteriovoracaceae bacterium]